MDEATRCFQQAPEIKPDFVEAHSNLGMVLAARRQFDAAMAEYHKALAIKPDYLEARNNLGYALAQQGRFAVAVSQYRKALEIAPNHAMIHGNLGNALTALGQFDDADRRVSEDIGRSSRKTSGPTSAWATCSAARSRFREAAAEYRKAMELEPRYLMAHGALAWLLATCPEASLRDGAAAIEHARRAEELCGGPRAEVLDTLAAAYAEAGRFAEAVATARKALELATRQNNRPLVRVLRTQMRIVRSGKALSSTPSGFAARPVKTVTGRPGFDPP